MGSTTAAMTFTAFHPGGRYRRAALNARPSPDTIEAIRVMPGIHRLEFAEVAVIARKMAALSEGVSLVAPTRFKWAAFHQLPLS